MAWLLTPVFLQFVSEFMPELWPEPGGFWRVWRVGLWGGGLRLRGQW